MHVLAWKAARHLKKKLKPFLLLVLLCSQALFANAIDFQSVYSSEYWNNVGGGQKKGQAFLGLLNSSLSINLEESLKLKNTSFFISFLAIHGQSVNTLTHSFQGISNLEADAQSKLYEFYLEHYLFTDTPFQSRLKAGMIDLNSEFDAIEFSSLFSNPSHGIGPDFSQSGEAGPSIYPDSTLAFMIDQQLLEETHLKIGLFDAIANNGKNTLGNRLSLKNRDGYLITTELIFKNKSNPLLEQLSLGAWHYTSAFDTYNGQKKHHNQGLYASLQSDFRDNQETGVTSFVRTGFAKDAFNQSQAYLGLGGVYYGLFQERPHDQLGLSVGTSFLSDAYKKTQTSSLESLESIIEISYLIQICDTFFIQPMLSYVINPGFETTIKNATLFGLKAELHF